MPIREDAYRKLPPPHVRTLIGNHFPHSRQLKSQYNFLHTSCNDKIASIIYNVTYKMLSLAGSICKTTFPSFFQGGVAGITYFGMCTILLSRPGWLKTDSTEIELFLRYVLRVLRLFRLKICLLSIKEKGMKK